MKDKLIAQIIEIEWRMFQDVPNIGGPAPCQQDWKTFEIMRYAQAQSLSVDALECYLDDLKEAENNQRNLMTEKYARIMESTLPLEYDHVKHLLPDLRIDVVNLIDKIVGIVLEWESELLEKFPYILRKGRPIYSSDDTPYITSLETYLRGEFATYSQRTLELYYENLLKQNSEKINGAEITLDYMVKRYGFGSLEEANTKLKPQDC